MEDNGIECPECGVEFELFWNRAGYNFPEYCPFCGEGMNYEESLQ
jgi:hypothetical protein